MSKSLDFCIQAALDPTRSSYSDRDWGKAIELQSTRIMIDEMLEGIRKYVLEYDDDGSKGVINIELVLNADADFQYFTSESFLSDGSLAFITDASEKLISRVLGGRSYYADLKEPEYGDTIEFTIGNLILLTEHGDFGTEEKPWLRERNTILLPVAMRYL